MTSKRRPVFTAYLQKLGFKSLTFPAKFSGGKCGLCAVTFRKDHPVVYFRDKGLCHEPCTTRVVSAEQLAADPTTIELQQTLARLRQEKNT